MSDQPTAGDIEAMREFIYEHQVGYDKLLETARFVRGEVMALKTVPDKERRVVLTICDLLEKPFEQMKFGELQWLATMIKVAEE